MGAIAVAFGYANQNDPDRGHIEDSDVTSDHVRSKNFCQDNGDRIYQKTEEFALQNSSEHVTGRRQNIYTQV